MSLSSLHLAVVPPNIFDSPEWGRLKKQIFGKGQKYRWESSWTFGTI